MRELQGLAEKGRLPAAGASLTVERWLTYWLEVIARPKLEPSTLAG
jgi:hypothetical protein